LSDKNNLSTFNLFDIRNNLGGNYKLMNDINLESKEWIPVGSNLSPFIGVIDGQGFTVRNLVITASNKNIGWKFCSLV
jgi:hypothetical protein